VYTPRAVTFLPQRIGPLWRSFLWHLPDACAVLFVWKGPTKRNDTFFKGNRFSNRHRAERVALYITSLPQRFFAAPTTAAIQA